MVQNVSQTHQWKAIGVLAQFSMLLLVAGFVRFLLLLIQAKTTLALFGEVAEFVVAWDLAFIVLGLLRLVFVKLVSRREIDAMVPAGKRKPSLITELSTTIQYLLIAAASSVAAFSFIMSRVATTVNLLDQWYGFQHIVNTTLIGFLVLSLIRLGVVCQNRKR